MRAFAAHNSVRSIQHSVANKQQSAVDVTKSYLQQLKSVEDKLNSFLTVDAEHALAQVREHCDTLAGLYCRAVLAIVSLCCPVSIWSHKCYHLHPL